MIHLTDIPHILLGILSGILACKGYIIHSITLAILYLTYQILDYLASEPFDEFAKDLQEFIIGFVIAVVVYSLKFLGIPIPI